VIARHLEADCSVFLFNNQAKYYSSFSSSEDYFTATHRTQEVVEGKRGLSLHNLPLADCCRPVREVVGRKVVVHSL